MENEINGFEIDEFNVHRLKVGATPSICPLCSKDRKPENQKQKCMSVNWPKGIGHCSHCGQKVQLHTYKKRTKPLVQYSLPPRMKHVPVISSILEQYSIKTRHVSKESLDALKVSSGKRWMPKAQKEIQVIEFPYFVNEKLVNIKYRGANKDFMFEPGCELVMYNLDNVMYEPECIVVEGEWDALSIVEAGFLNVTSVPNGFTAPRSDGTSTISLNYLNEYWQYFHNKEKIILAVDNDAPGISGKEEMIRRFGAGKCYEVDFKDCKDANEYLVKYGKEALREVILNATPIPIKNVVRLRDFRQQLIDFYLNGTPRGYTCGINNLDEIYSIEPGQYCIVTGPPQSGKSELVDSICLGYALRYGYKVGYASPENKPDYLHADKVVRKICGYKPTSQAQIDSARVKAAFEFYDSNFLHVEYDDGFTLEKVLDKFREMVVRNGVRVFVIDPFNKVRYKKSWGSNTNEYTADYLNEIDIFCKETKSVLYLVAHPNKLKKPEGSLSYPMPTAYDIKGGGEMFDMAYHILGVVRNMEHSHVEVKTLKVKFQHLGKFEETAYMKWNVNNGRYVPIPDPTKDEAVGIIKWDNESWIEFEEAPPAQMQVALKSKSSDSILAGFEAMAKPPEEYEVGDYRQAPF